MDKQLIQDQKKDLRKQVKKLKENISFEEKKILSSDIWDKLKTNAQFQSAKTIMLYWSMEDEVYTHDFVIECSGKKKVILPSVDGDNLKLKVFSSVSNLISGESYGIPEPNGEEFTEIEKIDLIIVPGVAFDKLLNRMGRGKAYYDKLLSSTPSFKIGVCFDFQLFDKVPCDEYDIKMNGIISNSSTIFQ